jgi:hypothetical protein
MSRTDDKRLLETLCSVDRYAKLRKRYDDEISIGYFRLLQARSNRTSIINTVENLRFEIDAALTIDGKNVCNVESDDFPCQKENFETIYLFSAMPPPALKAAQLNFQNAIELAKLLLDEINVIVSLTSIVEKHFE